MFEFKDNIENILICWFEFQEKHDLYDCRMFYYYYQEDVCVVVSPLFDNRMDEVINNMCAIDFIFMN